MSHPIEALLVLPRLQVQNANIISSPMTWGFPSIAAFAGLMTALERRLGAASGLTLLRVGVICHKFEPQVASTRDGRLFHLTSNPGQKDGAASSMIEEGRGNLNITLIFDVELDASRSSEADRTRLAGEVGQMVATMRVAGGSVIVPPGRVRKAPQPQLHVLDEDAQKRAAQFRGLRRKWLPGFALVSRDDLLQERHKDLLAGEPQSTLFDAWLDLSRLNYRARPVEQRGNDASTPSPAIKHEWVPDTRPGWIVPIPVGFVGITELHGPGTVIGARDPSVPVQFVECVYSVGQWVSPHRLGDVDQLMWQPIYDPHTQLYQCTNDFSAETLS